MAPEIVLPSVPVGGGAINGRIGEVTGGTPATWRHRRFGLKSAPGHRDFRPGKEGAS